MKIKKHIPLKYKKTNIAFLFVIVLGTILSANLIGPKGLLVLALMVLRPLVLEREKIEDAKSYLQLSYKILFSSLSIIFIMIVSIFYIIQFIPIWKAKLPQIEILFIPLLPFFLLTHGVIGIVDISTQE